MCFKYSLADPLKYCLQVTGFPSPPKTKVYASGRLDYESSAFSCKTKCTVTHNYTFVDAFSCLQIYTDLKDLFYDERPGYFEYAKETSVSV